MIEAMPEFKDWYRSCDTFDADAVLLGWLDKEALSRARGLAGLLLTGDTVWLERSGWSGFMEYEHKVNASFRRYHLVALRTCCMRNCTAEDVIDVCSHHEFALRPSSFTGRVDSLRSTRYLR